MIGITLQTIRDRCEDVGDCWIWRQAVTPRGSYPIMRVRPGGCLYVRRVVVALDGRPAKPRQPVVATTCGEARCCNPAHLQATTVAAVAQHAAAQGKFSSLTRRAKVAAHRRAAPGVKLTMEIAHTIRASDETGPVLAACRSLGAACACQGRTGNNRSRRATRITRAGTYGRHSGAPW